MHYWYLQRFLDSSLVIFVHEELRGRRTTLAQLVADNGEKNPFAENSLECLEDESYNRPDSVACENSSTISDWSLKPPQPEEHHPWSYLKHVVIILALILAIHRIRRHL
ncbi:unnamed protein product [Nippostrongylus brasiliensis]|uniref:Uncharacterized protein n=1 Tax=Nippostrongylus brasiliensis TaxID=27835 RepID=A0A0N4YQ83_NIPBR|nr:unnamed protein product [Nippostrongylus brasiliensis]